ncbi:MAG: DNRLRE domain-containing protein [Armatimonadota bacterium]
MQDEMVLQSSPGLNLGRLTVYGGLLVGTDYLGRAARSYLQWDLSTLDAGKPVSGAKLRAYLTRKYYAVEAPIEARLCPDDTWRADVITWANAPQPVGEAAAAVSPPLTAGRYYEWDVAALVRDELAGDKKLSVVLMDGGEGTNTYTYTYFAESEYVDADGAAYAPVLVVTQGGQAADTTPPVLSVSANHDTLWPPDHRYMTVGVTPTASDDSGQAPTVTLVSVVSDEPDDAKGEGDGHTTNDIVQVGAFSFLLRAERSATGDGRTYTLTYRATDASGNTATASCTAVVPRDKGAKGKK